MQFISSDTNVWLDFMLIKRLEYPFLLPYTCLKELLEHNGAKVRLPKNELEERIQKLEEMVYIQ